MVIVLLGYSDKMMVNFKFFYGLGGLIKKIGLKLTQLIPLYILVFIAYGDAFLPQPLSNASYNTRTNINKYLTTFNPPSILNNNKYNHQKSEKLIKDTQEKYMGGQKNNKNNYD